MMPSSERILSSSELDAQDVGRLVNWDPGLRSGGSVPVADATTGEQKSQKSKEQSSWWSESEGEGPSFAKVHKGQGARAHKVAIVMDPSRIPSSISPAEPEGVPAISEADRLEEMRKAVWEQAYEEGIAEGIRRERTSQEARRLERRLSLEKVLSDAVERLSRSQIEALAVIRDEVVSFALDLAEAVIGRELELASAPVRDALRRALQLAPPGVVLTVHVNPVDSSLLDQRVLSELESSVPGSSLSLAEDPTVEPGGCIVESGACRIDAQIGPALRRAREVLQGAA
jgi:flagellar biosynthesis/type III secretory pathway protein FliH